MRSSGRASARDATARPEVARVFAPAPGAPQPHFLCKEAVWICIPQDAEDVAILAGAIVHNLYNRAAKGRRGTYFLVDEAGSTITIENLDKYLQVARGLEVPPARTERRLAAWTAEGSKRKELVESDDEPVE